MNNDITPIATAKTASVVALVALFSLFPLIVLYAECNYDIMRESMYYHVFGDFLYVLVLTPPIFMAYKYYKYISRGGDFLTENNGHLYIFSKKIESNLTTHISNNNLFGPKIIIYYGDYREVIYQFLINEPIQGIREYLKKFER